LRKYEQARGWAAAPRSTARWPTARADDYNEWEARGCDGLGLEGVLPFFRKLERDLDFDGPYHGKSGRIPVRRIPREHGPGIRSVRQAFQHAGFQSSRPEGEFVDGYFPVTHSNQDEQRVSAAMGYLDRETASAPI